MTFAETGLGKKRAINNRVVQEPSSSISFAQCPQVARGVGVATAGWWWMRPIRSRLLSR
jgi:hypothetical protein